MCRKGENIRKRRDGRWEARYIKWRDDSGKIHYGSLYGKSYREVKEKQRRKIADIPAYGLTVHSSSQLTGKVTFENIVIKWKQHIRHTIKDSTFSNYEVIIKNHLLPEFRTIQIRKITDYLINQFIQKKKQQGLADGTLHVILSVLRSILKYAVKEGAYTKEMIHYPHVNAGRQTINIMKLSDYYKLENFLTSNMNNFNFGLLLCMNTGIRVGELSGLRWEDINFEQNKLQIRRTVSRIKNLDYQPDPKTGKIPQTILYIGPPKTEHSNREIPLPDKLLFYANQVQQKANTYILTGSEKCMEPRAIQRRYASLLKKCGIPPIKIHALRHQFSCRWVEHGFDTKSLSEILGHTSVKTTLDLYVHIQSDIKRKYMNEMMEPLGCMDF